MIFTSCHDHQPQKSQKEYQQKIDSWHQERVTSLKENDSWLTLAGLYPLKKKNLSFGSDSTNDIIFPPKSAGNIGTITREDSTFYIDIRDGINVLHDSSRISSIKLNPISSDETTILQHQTFLWYIIERRGHYYIRLKDQKHPNLSIFNGIDRFPVSQEWNIKAYFKPFDNPQTLTIPDILGDTYEETIYGTLEFSMDGENYSILPIGHPQKDDEFFIVLGDKTNGESTYSGGRYIYIPTPNEDGYTHIDFNKAYNPPCVFTDFATCPLPPPENRLDMTITAGEKVYEGSK
ncbi:DUF1684 domain-containing protein [Fodinibius saliphilus]|uniref:DUF1684 domain-containing protein n=1 Tax=Fodinibius saliphilus TaxID=1920650 RepID=UPI0014864F21|nr:DUF1684 domain-containing protein [Fodinibius saliphilus]